jgi:hypothetical protein
VILAEIMEGEIVCASCGRATPGDAVICPRCDQQPLQEPASPPSSHASNTRAGKAAVVLSIVLGAGSPLFGLLVGFYGLYRLSRVPSDSRALVRWRRFGVIVLVLLGVYWGILERGSRSEI